MDTTARSKAFFLLLYLTALLFWLAFWQLINGYDLMMSDHKRLWIPYLINVFFISGNYALNRYYWYIGSGAEEESLFDAINMRLGNAFTAATAVLAIAALTYTIKKQPASDPFVDFGSYTFIFGLISMLVLWIPGNQPLWKFYLRHFQTIFLCNSICLCMGSILILLEDIF